MTSENTSRARQSDKGHLRAIGDVADELGVSTRTIRFYEDRALISPQRAGTMRVYTDEDVARMKLILRGKRMGLSLREITELLKLHDVKPADAVQMDGLSASIHRLIKELQVRHRAIALTIIELPGIEKQARKRFRASPRS